MLVGNVSVRYHKVNESRIFEIDGVSSVQDISKAKVRGAASKQEKGVYISHRSTPTARPEKRLGTVRSEENLDLLDLQSTCDLCSTLSKRIREEWGLANSHSAWLGCVLFFVCGIVLEPVCSFLQSVLLVLWERQDVKFVGGGNVDHVQVNRCERSDICRGKYIN